MGSIRSGEKANLKFFSGLVKSNSSKGARNSLVVPGATVDSKINSDPSLNLPFMDFAADSKYERSGNLLCSSGVGTQITTISEDSMLA